MLDKGGFAWRMFVPGTSIAGGDPLGKLPPESGEQCAVRMRLYCAPRANNTLHFSAMMMNAHGRVDKSGVRLRHGGAYAQLAEWNSARCYCSQAGEGDDFLPSLAAFLAAGCAPHFAGEASLPVASVIGTISSQQIELVDQVGEVLHDVAHR